jgi:hypothetical protein
VSPQQPTAAVSTLYGRYTTPTVIRCRCLHCLLLHTPSCKHPSRQQVKGFISFAAPYGGTVAAIAPATSGEISALVPPEFLQGANIPQLPGVDALIREITWNAVKGMASLAMLLPYYVNGTDPVSALHMRCSFV